MTTQENQVETASFAIMASGNLPIAYKHISVKWSDISDNAPFFVIKYDRFKAKKWVVKFSHDFAFVSSAKSLSSAIRFCENYNKED